MLHPGEIVRGPQWPETVEIKKCEPVDFGFYLDDPGAGKTIMSGMLIRELQARGMVDRILILVPPLVLAQWRDELWEKFNLDFQVISRTTVSEAGGKNPFVEYPFCLASIYWASRDDIKHLVRDASFDLVIVDEAHRENPYLYTPNMLTVTIG